jgi:hypothetical protein
MTGKRLLTLIGLFLTLGCRGQAPNARSLQPINPQAVLSFPVAFNGADQEGKVTVKWRSDGVPLDTYLVLDKDSDEVTALLRHGQSAEDRVLAKAEGKGAATLTATTPAEGGIHLVVRNRSDKQALVRWEVSP